MNSVGGQKAIRSKGSPCIGTEEEGQNRIASCKEGSLPPRLSDVAKREGYLPVASCLGFTADDTIAAVCKALSLPGVDLIRLCLRRCFVRMFCCVS